MSNREENKWGKLTLGVLSYQKIFFFPTCHGERVVQVPFSLHQLNLYDNLLGFLAYCLWTLCIVTGVVLILVSKLTKEILAAWLESRNRLSAVENSGFIAI